MEDGEGISETKEGSVEAKETIPSVLLLIPRFCLCSTGKKELKRKWMEGERIVIKWGLQNLYLCLNNNCYPIQTIGPLLLPCWCLV